MASQAKATWNPKERAWPQFYYMNECIWKCEWSHNKVTWKRHALPDVKMRALSFSVNIKMKIQLDGPIQREAGTDLTSLWSTGGDRVQSAAGRTNRLPSESPLEEVGGFEHSLRRNQHLSLRIFFPLRRLPSWGPKLSQATCRASPHAHPLGPGGLRGIAAHATRSSLPRAPSCPGPRFAPLGILHSLKPSHVSSFVHCLPSTARTSASWEQDLLFLCHNFTPVFRKSAW